MQILHYIHLFFFKETSVERSRRSAENSKPREIVTVGPFEVSQRR